MPGIISKTEDLVQNVAPEWTSVKVTPRGVPRFPDQSLRGQIRYAIRVGSFLPNIQPDNRVKLVAPIQARSQEIEVDRIVDGMVAGSLVLIDGREIQLIADVMRNVNKLVTINLIKSDHDINSTIDLFGEPYQSTGVSIAFPKASLVVTQGSNVMSLEARTGGVRGNAMTITVVVPSTASTPFSLTVVGLAVTVSLETDGASLPITSFQQVIDAINAKPTSPFNASFDGTTSDVPTAFGPTNLAGGSETTQIAVRGRFPVLPGDQLWIQSDPELLLSGTNYNVVSVQGYSQSLALYNSVVTLDQPIPRDLDINDIVYLRAFPGYKSPVVNVPASRRLPLPMGPFVVDYVSGRFTDGASPVETLSLQTFDGLDNPVSGPYPMVVQKNEPVLPVPIHQSSFLFFKRYRGTVTYRNGKLVLRNDDRGRCMIFMDLVPAWSGPIAWQTRITFASPAFNTVLYRFFPNDLVIAGGGGGNASSTLTFEMTSTNAASNRLAIMTSGEPNAEIEMDGWNVVGQQVEKIQYGTSIQQIGAFDWQAGGLQIKPYLKTLADLYTQMDFDSLDAGSLLL